MDRCGYQEDYRNKTSLDLFTLFRQSSEKACLISSPSDFVPASNSRILDPITFQTDSSLKRHHQVVVSRPGKIGKNGNKLLATT